MPELGHTDSNMSLSDPIQFILGPSVLSTKPAVGRGESSLPLVQRTPDHNHGILGIGTEAFI